MTETQTSIGTRDKSVYERVKGNNVSQQLIENHLISGEMSAGEEIALRIDQTLTQDATGTLVMLEFEALNLPRVRTELSAQYVDHNLLQVDHKNADDHLFLQSACKKFGVYYSPPGNGVSHPVHMQRFGIPGKTLLGSDSHTCAAGSLGMLAIGAGGLEVAMAMAGEPFYLRMPKILGVKLTGELPPWVSAKDIILEMLRRHSVHGAINRIIEYYGPGLKHLSAMDRHVIANMGAELGATTTVFPSDDQVRRFLTDQGRDVDFKEILPGDIPEYDEYDEIDLSKLVPLIACPSSPDNVVPVQDVAGRQIYQSYIGSSANPGLRDFAVAALIVDGKRIHDRVSFDINPTSRQVMDDMIRFGYLEKLIDAGGRIHQVGCNGCIGMGQAPATGKISLRTVPRNFPGRSGTKEDQVYLCSPETAAASALSGKITDPRTLKMDYPNLRFERKPSTRVFTINAPDPTGNVKLQKGPNIRPLPDFEPVADQLDGPVLLKLVDNVSTDEIMPAGARILPYRSNIEKISRFAFERIDENFYERAKPYQHTGFFIIAGENYGQGSSREHAAIAPRYLGLRAVIAKSFARIHWQNLINFGILPLTFTEAKDYDEIRPMEKLAINHIREGIRYGHRFELRNTSNSKKYIVEHALSERQIDMILHGSLIHAVRQKQREQQKDHAKS